MSPKRDRFQQELERTYDAGEVIVREGETSTDMCVIQDGEVVVTKKVGDRDLVLRTMGKGDFFGEMALLESLPRSATVRASRRTKVLVIQPGGFLLKIRRDPTFAFEMLQRLSGRIRMLSEELAAALGNEKLSADRVTNVLVDSEFGVKEPGED